MRSAGTTSGRWPGLPPAPEGSGAPRRPAGLGSPPDSEGPRRSLANAPLRARRTEQPLEHRLLLTATFCLLAGGAVMVYSASSARTLLQGEGDGTSYLIKYVTYGAIGLLGMHIVSRLNLEHVRRYTGALLIGSFV